ncbi:hypothetical protein PYCC9005_001178 [Savitreella phatthalungensis]
MSSAVLKYLFKRNAPNLKFGTNPYYSADQLSDPSSKARRKFKPLENAGWSSHDRKIFKKVRRRAYRMDESITCFCCCSCRIGWSAVIGFIPVVGDVIDLLVALSIVRAILAIDGGVPESVKAQLFGNITVDFLVGLVPIVGDIADAMYKANTRNVQILEKLLDERAGTHTGGTAVGHSAAATGHAATTPAIHQPQSAQANPYQATSAGTVGGGGGGHTQTSGVVSSRV